MKWEKIESGKYKSGRFVARNNGVSPWSLCWMVAGSLRFEDFDTLTEAKLWAELNAAAIEADEQARNQARNAELEAVADSQAAEEEVRHELQS